MRRRCFNYSIADVISFLAEQFFRKLRRVRPRQRGQRFLFVAVFARNSRKVRSWLLVSTVLSEVNDVDNDSDSDSDEDDDVDDVTST